MTNLLTETLQMIAATDHETGDVATVRNWDGTYAMPWQDFEPVARDTDYDSGYGGQEIANDLLVVFTDGSYLERREYDGSEWWEHVTALAPVAAEAKPFNGVIRKNWDANTVAGIAEFEPDDD